MRDRFPISRKALKGWWRRLTPKQAAPLTRKLMLAFVAIMVEAQFDNLLAAVAVAWGALLWGNEVLVLRRQDVALAGDPRLDE